jgi:hypothetical protein
MDLLAQANTADTVRETMQVVNIGLGAFVAAIILLGLMILWLNRDKLSGLNRLMGVVTLLVGLPFLTAITMQKTSLYTFAISQILIKSVRISSIDSQGKALDLELSGPAFAVLEITDSSTGKVTTLIPITGLNNQAKHTFLLGNSQTGEAIFIINGVRIAPWGKPLPIN